MLCALDGKFFNIFSHIFKNAFILLLYNVYSVPQIEETLTEVERILIKEEKILKRLAYYRNFLSTTVKGRLELLTRDEHSIPERIKFLAKHMGTREAHQILSNVLSEVIRWSNPAQELKQIKYIMKIFDFLHPHYKRLVEEEGIIIAQTEGAKGEEKKESKYAKRMTGKWLKKKIKEERRIDKLAKEFRGHANERAKSCMALYNLLKKPQKKLEYYHMLFVSYNRFARDVKEEMELHREIAEHIEDYFNIMKKEVKDLKKEEKIVHHKSIAFKKFKQVKEIAEEIKKIADELAGNDIEEISLSGGTKKFVKSMRAERKAMEEEIRKEAEMGHELDRIDGIVDNLEGASNKLLELKTKEQSFKSHVDTIKNNFIGRYFITLSRSAEAAKKSDDPATITQHLQNIDRILQGLQTRIEPLMELQNIVFSEVQIMFLSDNNILKSIKILIVGLKNVSQDQEDLEKNVVEIIKNFKEKKKSPYFDKKKIDVTVATIKSNFKRIGESVDDFQKSISDSKGGTEHLNNDLERIRRELTMIQEAFESTKNTEKYLKRILNLIPKTTQILNTNPKQAKDNLNLIYKMVEYIIGRVTSFILSYSEAYSMLKRAANNCSVVLSKVVDQIDLNSIILEEMESISQMEVKVVA